MEIGPRTYSSRANYTDLFMKLPDPSFLIEASTMIIREANFASERMFLAEASSIIGLCVENFVEESERERFDKQLRMVARRFYPRTFESRWKIRGDQVIEVRITGYTLRLSDGDEALQLIVKDITQEKEAERRIASYVSELEILNDRLAKLSITDELTQLYNVRHFRSLLEQEHARSTRYKSRYAVVFLDLDWFKNFNDKAGHLAGDKLLRELADVIKSCCRVTDSPVRYGGEEFLVLCPETDAGQARYLAERIRKTVETKAFAQREVQPGGKVSVSIGVAAFPEHGAEAEAIVKAADQALYVSKESGRNRVTLWKKE
jgi:diguanylate cyclase (GGDEF)-like protein/PAS domain S-box-containing protein